MANVKPIPEGYSTVVPYISVKNASDAIADCDTLFNRAVEAGGKVRRPLTNQFYGDRSGTVEDPFGQVWTISTHVEDVPPDELRRRMEAFAKS